MAFTNSISKTKDLWTVTLSGEIDIYNADELKKGIGDLIEETPCAFVFDCAELNYIDSTGLGVLASAAKRVKDYDGDVRIINLKPHIGKVFYLTGLNRIMEVEVNEE